MGYMYGAKFTQTVATVAAATTDGILVSPAAGNKVKVIHMWVWTNGAQIVTVESDDAAGDRTVWKCYLAANGSASVSAPAGEYLCETEAGADLLWTTSAATDATIGIVYTEEP